MQYLLLGVGINPLKLLPIHIYDQEFTPLYKKRDITRLHCPTVVTKVTGVIQLS